MIGSPEERELPQTLVARASIPQVAGLPAIGSSRSSILDDFGSPTSETTDLLYYAWDEGEALPISLRFRFEREHLAEVLWDFGVD